MRGLQIVYQKVVQLWSFGSCLWWCFNDASQCSRCAFQHRSMVNERRGKWCAIALVVCNSVRVQCAQHSAIFLLFLGQETHAGSLCEHAFHPLSVFESHHWSRPLLPHSLSLSLTHTHTHK